MLRTPRHPSPAKSPPPAGRAGAISSADVDRAADQLLRNGQRPTIERVRATIGRGSPNTINPLLDAWWQRLAGRLDAGPAALHRLPEPVLHAAEGLWLQTLSEARKRAATEQGTSRSALARDRQELEIRRHVLSIRESELQGRLKQAERRTGQLELEVAALTTLLRKEQASRLATERHLNSSDGAPRRGRAPPPTAKRAGAQARKRTRKKTRTKARTKSRKAVRKSPRNNPARARKMGRSPRRARRVAQ
jgi:hypothetical protein